MKLDATTLLQARDAQRPLYERNSVTPGIVHLGIGNFHRAHQAVYIDDCLAADPRWGITGVSLRRRDMADAMKPQDCLYAVAAKDEKGTRVRIVGSICDVIYAGSGVTSTLQRLCDAATRIVTLTVTEKGYCHDPATGNLDERHADVLADLLAPAAPRSVPGLLVAALRRRRDLRLPPFTVLTCDNLPANGKTVSRIVHQFAGLQDGQLAAWIEREVAFPATMVDRIVPATTDADREEVAGLIGLEDSWPVMTEVFSQWVVEDRFSAGRPDLAAAGVQLVYDVSPYENMKLRMLNGAHSTLAYFGQLLGLETVCDAISDPDLDRFVSSLWHDEIIPTLQMPRTDLESYAGALSNRFRNPALRHRTAQIAMDGSQKIPQRLLNTLRDRLDRGLPHSRLSSAVAAWIVYASGGNGRYSVNDPLAPKFERLAAQHLPDARSYAEAMLDLHEVFGDLAARPAFRNSIVDAAVMIAQQGPRALLRRV